MLNYDYSVAMKLAQKKVRDRLRRSEAEQRLYWSTCEKMMTRQAPALRKKNQVWMRLGQLLRELRRGWLESVPSEKRVSAKESQAHPLVSEEVKA